LIKTWAGTGAEKVRNRKKEKQKKTKKKEGSR
jgi:hypothetical protein